MKKTFEEWMKEVNKYLIAKCGMDSRDLPDVCYRDWYDNNVSAKSAASRAFKSAKDDM